MLQAESEAALKAEAIKEVKRLIATYGISKGDIRGATMNILNGKKIYKFVAKTTYKLCNHFWL